MKERGTKRRRRMDQAVLKCCSPVWKERDKERKIRQMTKERCVCGHLFRLQSETEVFRL